MNFFTNIPPPSTFSFTNISPPSTFSFTSIPPPPTFSFTQPLYNSTHFSAHTQQQLTNFPNPADLLPTNLQSYETVNITNSQLFHRQNLLTPPSNNSNEHRNAS